MLALLNLNLMSTGFCENNDLVHKERYIATWILTPKIRIETHIAIYRYITMWTFFMQTPVLKTIIAKRS